MKPENGQCIVVILGTTISRTLKWEDNTSLILSKAHQRLHFLRQLKKFGVPREAMVNFYRATVESVLTFSVSVWYGNITALEKKQLERLVSTASKITAHALPTVSSIYATRIKRKIQKVVADSSSFVPLPSGRRLQSLKCRTSRFRNSTYPEAVRLLNSDPAFTHSLCPA